jgi:hypothetical protein
MGTSDHANAPMMAANMLERIQGHPIPATPAGTMPPTPLIVAHIRTLTHTQPDVKILEIDCGNMRHAADRRIRAKRLQRFERCRHVSERTLIVIRQSSQ